MRYFTLEAVYRKSCSSNIVKWKQQVKVSLEIGLEVPPNDGHIVCFLQLLGTPTKADLCFIKNEDAMRYLSQLPRHPRHPRKSLLKTFPHVNPSTSDLVEKMLTFDPAKRITADLRAVRNLRDMIIQGLKFKNDHKESVEIITSHEKLVLYVVKDMERDFLIQKRSRVGRGVKEKDLNRNKKNNLSGISVTIDQMINYDEITPIGVALLSGGLWVKLHGVPVMAFSEDGLSAIATKLGTPLMLNSYSADICINLGCQSSNARAMIKHPPSSRLELKDNIVVAMPKIAREVHYTCNICGVEYEWKPPRCTSCKVFGHILEECPKNTGACETKTIKKPNQTSRGVPVGPKVGFKPQKEYRPVPKKPNASLSGNKKNGMEPTIKVSNSNPFDVLNSVDNDVELGTNGETTNLVNNEANSSGSSFTNVDNSSTGTTLIIGKIGKFKYLLSSGQAILVDNAGNPLKKVELPGDCGNEDEVASIDNDMSRSLALERVGFGTQSLREQWRDSYGNGDYDEDPYDDDMYKGQDITQEIEAICDNLDIRV
ncbi:retrotransposon protein, putative, ty1-copia subclass [Tanacetum coccineum]